MSLLYRDISILMLTEDEDYEEAEPVKLAATAGEWSGEDEDDDVKVNT